MIVSFPLPAMAPQPTAHPAALPPDPAEPSKALVVTPTSTSETSRDLQSGQEEAAEERLAPPPSLIQIKIAEILDQQAKELAQQQDG